MYSLTNKTKRELNISESFQGCVQYLQVNGQILDVSFPSEDIKNGLGVGECVGNKCMHRLCLNGGRCHLVFDISTIKTKAECVCNRGTSGKLCETRLNPCQSNPCNFVSNESRCVPTSNGYFQCVCSPDFEGIFCEKRVIVKPSFTAAFNGKSFIERPSLGDDLRSIDLFFYAKKPEGVLLYNGDKFNKERFIGLKVDHSYVVFVVSLNGKFEKLM